MKRVLLVLAAGLITVAAVLAPRPPEPAGPSFTGIGSGDEETPSAQATVWYCPWLSAGAERDSWLMLAADDTVNATITLPSPIPNEPADTAEETVFAQTALPVEVADIRRRGDSPGFVEFDGGPSAVAALVVADSEEGATLISGDRCPATLPKLWHLPGGTTRRGRTTILRLFNPFPDDAKVTVSGTSEFGDAGLVALESVDVPGRSWQDFTLNDHINLLDNLNLTVSAEEGLVVPALVVRTDGDEATWPGSALSTTWEFPQVRQTGLVPTLVVSNPGSEDVDIVVDVYDADGSALQARSERVAPAIPGSIELSDLADGFFGIRVTASGPVAAVVVAEDRSDIVDDEGTDPEDEEEEGEEEQRQTERIAGTVGAPAAATRWLLPVPGTLQAATSTVWVLNTGTEAVNAELQPLGLDAIEPETLVIAPGSVARVVLPQEDVVTGYLIAADGPVSASWSVESGDGVAMVAGIPVDG